MNSAYLLVMLTFNAADQAGLSFLSTQTMEQCQLKGHAFAGILSSSGIEVREKRCIESPLQFTKYQHSSGKNQPLQRYQATFTADHVEISFLPAGKSCTSEHPNTYCATSPQQPLQ